MLTSPAIAAESSEERFRAIFGTGRSASWHPCAVKTPETGDFDHCRAVELANDQTTLYCRPEALEPWEPFLWVTREGNPEPTYLASIDAWRHDAPPPPAAPPG